MEGSTVINANKLTVISDFQIHYFLFFFFFFSSLSTCATCSTDFAPQSFENKCEPLRLRDPPVIKAGICYAAQEANGICFSSGESSVSLVCSLTQEQQMFRSSVIPLLSPIKRKAEEREEQLFDGQWGSLSDVTFLLFSAGSSHGKLAINQN